MPGWRDLGLRPVGRRPLLVAAGAASALLAAFLVGQYTAGHSVLGAQIAERRLGRELSKLRTEARRQAAELARLQTDAQVNGQAYAELERQLASLQGELIEAQEQTAFYRGIVGGRTALAIREFALSPAEAGTVQLRFVLAQPGPDGGEARGRVQVRVDGRRAGQRASLDLTTLNPAAGAPDIGFAFRYFQEISTPLHIPADFTPERVVIRLVPATAGLKAGVESFPWSVRGA